MGVRLYGSRLAVFPPIKIKSDLPRRLLNLLRSCAVDKPIDEPPAVVAPSEPTIKLAVVITSLIGSRLASVSGFP